MDIKYKDIEDLKKTMLHKRIIEWNKDNLVLEDGMELTIECSEQDCCAHAGGIFKDVKLDAVITDVECSKIKKKEEGGSTQNKITVTIYHNQNPIALAECYADNGNGGYYYSICSIVVNNIHYKVVEA